MLPYIARADTSQNTKYKYTEYMHLDKTYKLITKDNKIILPIHVGLYMKPQLFTFNVKKKQYLIIRKNISMTHLMYISKTWTINEV